MKGRHFRRINANNYLNAWEQVETVVWNKNGLPVSTLKVVSPFLREAVKYKLTS